MVPRRPLDFFSHPISTRPKRSRRIPLSTLQCALTDKHRDLPVFGRNPSHSSPLDATLIRVLLSVDSKRLREKLSSLDATLTKNQGEGAAFSWAFRYSVDSASPIAGDRLWCHNPPWYEKSRQPRETNSPVPVSKISERTSGTSRSSSRLQVVPRFSVLLRVSGFVLTNPELS
jgi:hypothetical protein